MVLVLLLLLARPLAPPLLAVDAHATGDAHPGRLCCSASPHEKCMRRSGASSGGGTETTAAAAARAVTARAAVRGGLAATEGACTAAGSAREHTCRLPRVYRKVDIERPALSIYGFGPDQCVTEIR